MSSRWCSVAESWTKGNATDAELVIEATLEGQLTELETFFREHPPSFTGSQTFSREVLDAFACHCAFVLLGTQQLGCAVHVLRNVHGEESVWRWLNDAFELTLDTSMRNRVADYLREHQQLNDDHAAILDHLMKVQSVYSMESFSKAMERYKSCSHFSFLPNGYSQMEASLRSLLPRGHGPVESLTDSVEGISIPRQSRNVWAQLWRDYGWNEDDRQITMPLLDRSMERQSVPSLFFKAAAQWFQNIHVDGIHRILLESEVLTIYLNQAAGPAQLFDDLNAQLKAELQYCLSHNLLDQALERFQDLPVAFTATSAVTVFQNSQEALQYQGNVLTFDAKSLCTSYAWNVVAERLFTKGLWPQTRWESVEEWVGFLAKTGVLLGTSSVHDDVERTLQSRPCLSLVVQFCVHHQLPNVLERFLEVHMPPMPIDRTLLLLRTARGCQWAEWLILSMIPQQEFATTICNAKYLLAKHNFSVKWLSDLAQADSIHVILTALAHSPRPLSKTLLLEAPSLVESPSEGDEFTLEDGFLCPVDPVCCLADIEPQLQERYPETCRALEAIPRQEIEHGPMSSKDFRAWRNRMFRTELGDLGFKDMVMTSGIKELEHLLEIFQSSREPTSDPNQTQDAQFWEQRHLDKISKWVDGLCYKDFVGGLSIGVCRHLICGRPMAALEWFVASKNATSGSTELSEEDIRYLELLTRLIAIWNFKDTTAVFASLLLAFACGIETSKIKADVAALQRLDALPANTVDVPALVEDLATDVAMEYSDGQSEGSIPASRQILVFLENAVLSTCTVQPLMSSSSRIDLDAPATLSESTDAVLRWSLIHAFAKTHKQTPSKRLLEKLAQADDWILFLTEATFFQSSIDEVIYIARAQFADPNLGHHVCYILEGRHEIEREPSSLLSLNVTLEQEAKQSSSSQINLRPISEELFDILHEAESTMRPIQALLLWARQLRWRLLSVIAACYSPSAYVECLVTWLEIGIASATETPRYSAIADAGMWRLDISKEETSSQLMGLVYELCSKGQFEELLDGLWMFPIVPLQPIKHFLAALKYYRTHMFNATSQHLRAFEDTLDKEIKKQNMPKEPISTSPTTSTVHSVHVDSDLVGKITQSAMMATLSELSSPFEREKLFEVLTRMEIDDCLSWLQRLRILREVYRLLGAEADGCIDWSLNKRGTEPPSVDACHVLEQLLEDGKWEGARNWASENDMSTESITRKQAEALIQEWTELGFEEELADVLWEQINSLFMDKEYPCLKAGLFFIEQATKVEQSSQKFVLLEALQWIDGTKLGCVDQAPRLTGQLTRTLCLMDNDGDIIQRLPSKGSAWLGSRSEKCPAVQMVLRPVSEVTLARTGSDPSRSSELSTHSSPRPIREISKPTYRRFDAPLSEEERQCLEILKAIVPPACNERVQRVIKFLLDHGQIEAAQSIQQSEDLVGPIEFFLVETALAIVQKCGSNSWNGEPVEKVVFVSILQFLQRKELLDASIEPKPQEVLDAVVSACKNSGGYSVCSRAAVTFRAASLLNMSCVELASYGPNKALELLLLKGDIASEIVREFVAAFEFTPRATAKKLAQMYLNSLMGTRGISSINENEPIEEYELSPNRKSSALINNSTICSDCVEIGNALMQLLVERYCVLTAEIEADILVHSYQCYERVNYVEGLDVLLDLATARARDFAADEKYEAMVKLTVGICRFDGLSDALDIIVRNRKLDLLLQDTNSHNPATASTLRSAILSSIYRHSPKDSQTLNATYRHFNMHVEVGQGIKDKAMQLLDAYTASGRPSRDLRLLNAMDLLIRAAAEFSVTQCSVSAAACGALVALVGQQICCPERKWVCLTDAECRALLPQLSDISSALIVARAYKFNSPQDWVLTLWQHMLHISTIYRGRWISSVALNKAMQTMFQYCSGIMKEIILSDEHLEQIMHMYVAFPCDEASHAHRVSYSVLTQCIVQFLHSITDIRQRLALCRMMKGDDAVPLIRECHSMLDIQPPPE